MRTSIHILSLSALSSRSVDLSKRLTSFDFSFEFIDAVDGRKLNLDQFPQYDQAHARYYMGRDLVGGEIGCYLSHLKAAKAFLASDAQIGIVLEDDSAPDANLVSACEKVATYLQSSDPEWLLVNIGNSSDKLTSDLAKLPNTNHHLQAAHYFPITTHGLLWSRRGAQTFIEEHDTIWAPVDNYFRHWLTREGHGYAIHPPIVGVTGAESVIAPTANGQKRQYQGRAWYFQFAKQKRLFIDKLIAKKMKSRFSRVQQGPSALPAE